MVIVLTKNLVQAAERGEGPDHPLVQVIRHNLPQIIYHDQQLAGLGSSRSSDDYVREKLPFLADDIEDAGDFELDPFSMIRVWSDIVPATTGRVSRYTIARMIESAYAMRENGSEWKRIPRYLLEHMDFPPMVVKDKEGLRRFVGRLQEIKANARAIEVYVNGSETSPLSLAYAIERGDPEAIRQKEVIEAHQKEHDTPLLLEVRENFRGALTLISIVNGAISE